MRDEAQLCVSAHVHQAYDAGEYGLLRCERAVGARQAASRGACPRWACERP